MNLAKALKLKNKKLSEYNKTVQKMRAYNSYDVDSKKVYNSKELMAQAEVQLNDYVALKSAIHSTSEPIRAKIFRLGELKSFLTNISSMSTTEGIVKSSNYSSTSTFTYAVDVTEEEKEAKVKLIQDEIEAIQDEIDTFNALTSIVGY
jgi:hypothetical protein